MDRYSFLADLSGRWAIHEQTARSFFPTISGVLAGNHFDKGDEPLKNRPYISGVSVEEFLPGNNSDTSDYDNAPKGSIAIIPLNGVMTRHSQFCGPVGMETMGKRIVEAASHQNISGVIIQADTGGGAMNAINPLKEAILSAKSFVPVIGFVDERLASAGLMALNHCDTLIASNNLCEIGSLGVMAAFQDFQPSKESDGIIFHKMYSDLSPLKNKSMEEALKGNYKRFIEKELNPAAEEAIAEFKSLRTVSDDDVFKGEMFYAKNALEIGLIDHIGNLEFAVKFTSDMANKKQSATPQSQINNRQANNLTPTNMNPKDIQVLLLAVGLSALEGKDDQFTLNAEQVTALENHFSKNHDAKFSNAGFSFDTEGNATANAETLIALNGTMTELMLTSMEAKQDARKADLKQAQEDFDKKLASQEKEFKDKLVEMGADPEKLDAKPTSGQNLTMKDYIKNATGFNKISADRPWNQAAAAKVQGHKAAFNSILANGISDSHVKTFIADFEKAASIDTTNMDAELGSYFREVAPDINEIYPDGEEISAIFPFASSGTQDIFTQISSYVSEHLQARNGGEWADKGSNEFQAESVRLKPWEVTRTFKREQIQQFMTNWLATKTKGTDPYQESFLMWFINYFRKAISTAERPRNAILGVYVVPATDVPGKSVHSMSGALKTAQDLVNDKIILPFKVGKGNYDILDSAGNVNKNHVFYKIEAMIKLMPQLRRDGWPWTVLMSKEDYRERNIFIKKGLAFDPNYQDQEKAFEYTGFSYKAVPYWPNGLYLITLEKNGIQLYRDKADDNRMHVERLKRNTYVHMDGASAFMFPITGKQFETEDELIASKGAEQFIFTNAEFGAYTPVDLLAGDTTPSVVVHNVLRTAENAGATVITTLDDSVVGQAIYIIGGSDTNPSTIASANTNFIGLTADITFNEGVVAKFIVTATGKFTLVDLYEQGEVGAIQFTADDATPSVSGGQLFITNTENTTGNEGITDFDDTEVGVQFTVLGGGGTFPSVITKAAKFAQISATWTGTDGESITLQKRTDGLFVEVI